MSDTTTRALALLNLLQTHRHWPGSELAGRLGVTERTVRRDVERLRDLGYRIESIPGAAGGYRLEAGSAVPPLLLTDEEAVAMAIGLRVAASQRLVSGPETTITALAKLDEETAELRAAVASGSRDAVREEVGDALFTLAMLARRVDVDADEALSHANAKFQSRFARVEASLKRRGTPIETAGAALGDGCCTELVKKVKTGA